MKSEIVLLRNGEFVELLNAEVLVEIINEKNSQMNLEIKNDSGKKIFKIFCIGGEQGRIPFSNINNFPDGIFMEWIDTDKIMFHIIEQKLSAYKELTKITKQLFSGYFHTKILSSILNIPKENVSYQYYVSYVNDVDSSIKYASRLSGISIPGERALPSTVMDRWNDSEVTYVNEGYSKTITFSKIQLDKIHQTEIQYDLFSKTIII